MRWIRWSLPALCAGSILIGGTAEANWQASLVASDLGAEPRLHDLVAEAASHGFGPAEAQQAAPDDLFLTLLLPPGDTCSPRGAFLLCPGVRVMTRGSGPDAPIAGIWRTSLLEQPVLATTLIAGARARWGEPREAGLEEERNRGAQLQVHRLRWSLSGPPREIELSLVLAGPDAEEGATVRVMGLSVVRPRETPCPPPSRPEVVLAACPHRAGASP